MNRRTILLHIATWTVLLLSPLSFVNHGEGVSLPHFLMLSVSPLMTMGVFYVNYFWLTPRYYVPGKRKLFFTVNTLMVVTLAIALHYWLNYSHILFAEKGGNGTPLTMLNTLAFIARNFVQLAFAVAIATTMHLSMRWHRSEDARLEAEAARADAELRNLRNQISPHFLLNTLNNIYALTAFDSQRAQEAIQQLSKLLRHMLYDNLEQDVKLEDEVLFLQSYVNLMKLRLPPTVDISFNVTGDMNNIRIAPLLLISLVENAFKHGISPTEQSFVHVNVYTDNGKQVVCDIENSNHPKTESDRSGHGIGLQQVQRRLDLCYPEHYTWTKGPSADGHTYHSRLTLNFEL